MVFNLSSQKQATETPQVADQKIQRVKAEQDAKIVTFQTRVIQAEKQVTGSGGLGGCTCSLVVQVSGSRSWASNWKAVLPRTKLPASTLTKFSVCLAVISN